MLNSFLIIMEGHLPFTFLLRDPDLVKRIGAATAVEVRATGIPYTVAPCIAGCRDPRLVRCYEHCSEDHKIVEDMTDVILGLQGEHPSNYKAWHSICWWQV